VITYDNTNYRFDKHIVPYFRTKEVSEIGYYALTSFFNEMSKLEICSNTISIYIGLVRMSNALTERIATNGYRRITARVLKKLRT